MENLGAFDTRGSRDIGSDEKPRASIFHVFHVRRDRVSRIVNPASPPSGLGICCVRWDRPGFLNNGRYKGGRGEVGGFLHWIRPDAVIPRNPRRANRAEYISLSLFEFNLDSNRLHYPPFSPLDTRNRYQAKLRHPSFSIFQDLSIENSCEIQGGPPNVWRKFSRNKVKLLVNY